MRNFFIFRRKEDSGSKDTAVARLKETLLQDRFKVTPQYLEMVRRDVLRTLSSYMDVVTEEADIRITQMENGRGTPVLTAHIPLRQIKRVGQSAR